jgi:hypothetical protein
MHPTLVRLSVELRKIALEVKYGSHDKRSYMFFWDDYMDILKDVDTQVGLVGGIPSLFEEGHVFETTNGFEITLDPKDWEEHAEHQTHNGKPVSIPEIGEPRLILRKGGRVWKMTPSDPDVLYRQLGIRKQH